MQVTYEMLDFWFQKINFRPSPWQREVHELLLKESKNSEGPLPRLVVLGGGEQSGKSLNGAYFMFAMHPFGKIFWIVGERYEDCRKEFEYLTQAAVSVGALDPSNIHDSLERSCRAVFNNGLVVRTLSSGDVTTLASESPDGILMVEAGRQASNAFRILWGRAHHHTAWFLVSGTFEQYKGRWFPDLWRECQSDNDYYGDSVSLPSYANPENFPLGSEDPKIKAAQKTLTEGEFSERFLGVPRPTIGVVFPEFRRSVHVRAYAEYDPMYPIRLWVDQGYYPSSYAILWVQIVDRQVRIFDEVYVQHMVNEEVIGLVKQDPRFSKIERVVIDIAAKAHAGAQEPSLEVWKKSFVGRGVPIVGKFVKIEDGLKRTHDKLIISPLSGQPYLVVHPRCVSTIFEFEEGYRYPTRRTGEVGQNLPLDRDNHAMKALAYGLYDHFGAADSDHITILKPRRRMMAYDRSY